MFRPKGRGHLGVRQFRGVGKGFVSVHSLKFAKRIPKVARKVLNLIVFDADAFGFKLLLHRRESAEMVLTGQYAEAVDHPVRGHVGQAVGRVHGVPDRSGSAGAAEVAGDGSVARNATFGDLANHRVDPLKKIRFRGAHAKRNLR